MNDMVQQLRGAARGTDRFVRSSPWRAVGTVALAGLAAGILVSQSAEWRRRFAAGRLHAGRLPAGGNHSADSEVAGG
jgi:hypothetical protein